MEELSSFSIGRPEILWASLLILPALLFVIIRIKKIERSLFYARKQKSSASLKFSLFMRTFLRCLSWLFAVLAFAEISFGSKKVPVHKSGSNVSFVFDISYSMLAKDAPSRLSRLDAVKIYAKSLIENFPEASFSAVLAKGDGFVAISETEDKNAMLNLIDNLSPKLMTSGGSSLAKGIEAALTSIPQHSEKSQYIWIFTDGDETDNLLVKSMEKAQKFGVPVSIVGFGSENESEVIAGDGKTRVKTALRAKKMKEICEEANEKTRALNHSGKNQAIYVSSTSSGSAWLLLGQIKKSPKDGEEKALGYEIQNVKRHGFFIFFSIVFLLLSFVAGELNISKRKKLAAILAASLLLTSCKSEKKQILEGSWAWYEGKYTSATADFLNVAQNADEGSLAREYAIFDLSATYLSLGESEAAFERLSEMQLENENLPADLRSTAYYNMGIISSRKNDYRRAADYFKKSILANPKNQNAKINLELCVRELVQKLTNSAQAQMQGVNEEKQKNPQLNSEIFNLIRENEGKKWRNMSDGRETEDDVLDY